MEASRVEGGGGFISFARLTPGELGGAVAGLVLAGSLFLPWFGTSASNPRSTLAGATGGDTVVAWDVFPILRWLLLAAATAPFILAWIVARGHKLTWKPGELTMVVGISAFVLVICNGIILGRPAPADGQAIEISLQWGYPIAIAASLALGVSGYLRQAFYGDARKPPGVL